MKDEDYKWRKLIDGWPEPVDRLSPVKIDLMDLEPGLVVPKKNLAYWWMRIRMFFVYRSTMKRIRRDNKAFVDAMSPEMAESVFWGKDGKPKADEPR